MYTRELQPQRSTPLENGIPVQGTWDRAFDEVNLLDIKKPYAALLPAWIRDFRVKEWGKFIIYDKSYFLYVLIANLKIFRIASVIIMNFESGEPVQYSKIIPGKGWRLPRELKNADVSSRSFGFFFNFHSRLDSGILSLDVDIESSQKKPPFSSHTRFNIVDSGQSNTPMAVNLLFSERRNMYSFKVMAPVQGDVVAGEKYFSFDPAETSGIFCDAKGFFPRRVNTSWCSGMGFDQKGRRFGFSIGENMTKEPFQNNENALWVDGRLTPLPPVKITYSGGPDEEYVIQDLEGMVDLVFAPVHQVNSRMNLLVCRSDFQRPIGIFNGVMVNAQGEKIQIKNLWGIFEKLYLRV